MGITQRFGLTRLDADTTLDSDGGKFGDRDRSAIDRILAQLEIHNHDGGDARLDAPAAVPTLTLATAGGQLMAGTTFYYRVSYVDQYGLETAASDEVAVTTPDPVAMPGAPNLEAVAGGTLSTGLHWYALTAVVGDEETQLSPPSLITVSDLKSVQLTFPNGIPAGATGLGIWRQGPMDAGFTKIATVATADPWVDDGSIPSDPCACDPENLPPDVNLTNSTNQVTVTIDPAVVAEPTLVKRWRIYRSTVSGSYGAESLVHEVVETTEETSGPLVNSWIDTGDALAPGTPLQAGQTLAPPSIYTFPVGAALPDPTGKANGEPFLLEDGTLHAVLAGAYQALGGAGVETVASRSAFDYHRMDFTASTVVAQDDPYRYYVNGALNTAGFSKYVNSALRQLSNETGSYIGTNSSGTNAYSIQYTAPFDGELAYWRRLQFFAGGGTFRVLLDGVAVDGETVSLTSTNVAWERRGTIAVTSGQVVTFEITNGNVMMIGDLVFASMEEGAYYIEDEAELFVWLPAGRLAPVMPLFAGAHLAIGGVIAAGEFQGAIALGPDDGATQVQAGQWEAVVIGSGAIADAVGGGWGYQVVIGAYARAATEAIAIGDSATALAENAVALGYSASAGHTNATALGQSATTTAANQIMLGTASEHVTVPRGDIRLGQVPAAPTERALYVDTDGALKYRSDAGTITTVAPA